MMYYFKALTEFIAAVLKKKNLAAYKLSVQYFTYILLVI